MIVDKGETRSPSTNYELADLHANYTSDKLVLTSLGGYFQQLYYVVASILEKYGDDLNDFYKRRKENPNDENSKKANSYRELMIEQFFLPLLVSYFRDSKCDAFSIVVSAELAHCFDQIKVAIAPSGHYDMSKLSKEQWIKFRYHFIEERMKHPLWIENNNKKAMELILSALALIICKKIPAELAISKIDNLHNKVRLLPPPQGEQKPQGAVVRLTKVTRPGTPNENEAAKEEVELDQNHKAVAMNGRSDKLPYTVPVINQYAASEVRADFLRHM